MARPLHIEYRKGYGLKCQWCRLLQCFLSWLLFLQKLGKPLVGLEFTSVAKNYTYVPRCFAAEILTKFPDASIVDDDTPGAMPMDQHKHGASRQPIGSRGLLITHAGVAKIMGAPFRALCPGEGLERGLAWLAARAGEQAAGVAKLFAHIGLKTVNDLAEERHGQDYSNYKAGTIALPESETKCRCSSLDTASPRASTAWLAIFPQSSPNLPSALWTTSSLPRWRAAQVSPQLTSQQQHRAAPSSQCAMGASLLPGAATTAPAQHISSVANFQNFI